MRIVATLGLFVFAAAIAGCGSHESSQDHDRQINSRAGANPAPVINDKVVNQAADKAVDTIEAAAATANQVTADVNHTAVKAQVAAQQVTNDAARAGNSVMNTATHDLNNATRDVNQLQNAFR